MSKQALVSFRMNDGEYSFVMPADDWEDAERRLRAIRTTATVTGFPCHRLPTNALTLPFVHLFAELFTRIRNALR